MSYNKTSAFIKSIDQRNQITVDELYDLIACVLEDSYEFSGVDGISELKLGEEEESKENFARKMNRIVNALTVSYDSKKEMLQSIRENLQNRTDSAFASIKEIENDLNKLTSEIKAAEVKEESLKTQERQLEETRGHLLAVEEECKELQSQIEVLSDPALDQKAQEKDALEADYNRRLAEVKTLDEQKESVQKMIDRILNEIQNIGTDIQSLKNRLVDLDEEEREQLRKKSELEKEVEEAELKVAEHQKWIDEFPAMSEGIQERFHEMQTQIRVLMNALNSAVSDDFLMKTLYQIPNTQKVLSLESFPDCNAVSEDIKDAEGLKTWFDTLGMRIESLLTVYETMLRALVLQSKSITESSDN